MATVLKLLEKFSNSVELSNKKLIKEEASDRTESSIVLANNFSLTASGCNWHVPSRASVSAL
jgi:hypothetical protein